MAGDKQQKVYFPNRRLFKDWADDKAAKILRKYAAADLELPSPIPTLLEWYKNREWSEVQFHLDSRKYIHFLLIYYDQVLECISREDRAASNDPHHHPTNLTHPAPAIIDLTIDSDSDSGIANVHREMRMDRESEDEEDEIEWSAPSTPNLPGQVALPLPDESPDLGDVADRFRQRHASSHSRESAHLRARGNLSPPIAAKQSLSATPPPPKDIVSISVFIWSVLILIN